MNSINSDSSGSAARLVEVYRSNQDFATFDPKCSFQVEQASERNAKARDFSAVKEPESSGSLAMSSRSRSRSKRQALKPSLALLKKQLSNGTPSQTNRDAKDPITRVALKQAKIAEHDISNSSADPKKAAQSEE